jgi:biotin carboxylase
MIPSLVLLATGVDLAAWVVARAAGVAECAAPTTAAVAPAAAVRFLLAPGDGTVAAVNGVDAAAESPGIHEVHVAAVPGGAVSRSGSFRDRIGHVIATGPTALAAGEAARLSIDLVQVRLRQEPRKEPSAE